MTGVTYLDSSVLLRPLLQRESPLDLSTLEPFVTSRITRIEVLRVLERLHLQGTLRAKSLLHRMGQAHSCFRRMPILELEDGILARAEAPMPVPVRALDALHLASALHLREVAGETPLFATHDRALADAARACGFEVVGA